MERSISAPFIRHPIATSLLMIGIIFAGIVAYPRLPVAPLPQVDFPTIQISAQLPGADPETMASAVAQPLETQASQIPGVTQITSTSSLGSTAIVIQFSLDRDIDGAANDVQAAINAASGQLPKNLPSPPTYRKVNPADSPILLLGATYGRDPACAADQPNPRRRASFDWRPAEAGVARDGVLASKRPVALQVERRQAPR
jgi:hydrophobic/amphiphilic exporter-1 (mainly G- bacteria), HAE1 family